MKHWCSFLSMERYIYHVNVIGFALLQHSQSELLWCGEKKFSRYIKKIFMRANSHCFKRKRVLVQTSKTKMGEIEIEKSQLARFGEIFNVFVAWIIFVVSQGVFHGVSHEVHQLKS